MGNSLPLPCVCQEAQVVATDGAKKRRRKKRPAKSSVRAAPRHMVVPVDAPENGGDEEEMKKAWPGCQVEPVGGDGVRVKVVMKKKDALELMARLEERGARTEEPNTELGGGMMSPCRDAWRPRLASIPEN